MVGESARDGEATVESRRRRSIRMLGGAGALLVGLLTSLSCTADSSTAGREVVPDDDERLTQEEHRWCAFEVLRLEGMNSKLNAAQGWEVERHNAEVDTYNRLCSGKKYESQDGSVVQGELTPERQDALRQAGVRRMLAARAEREARRVYVEAAGAKVHSAPGREARQIAFVPRWTDLVTTGRTQEGWSEIEWRTAEREADPARAWVYSALLASGSGRDARSAFCQARAGEEAFHGEVVRGVLPLGGNAPFGFDNGFDVDVYAKLLDEAGQVVVGFLIAAGKSATVENIPPGSYEVVHATGRGYSRGCDSFSQRGSAKRITQRVVFRKDGSGKILRVWSDGDGTPLDSQPMSYDEFESL